jgi:hypothetical protein
MDGLGNNHLFDSYPTTVYSKIYITTERLQALILVHQVALSAC